MDYSEKLKKIFQENGLKLTPQRLAVFDILNGNMSHPTADDVFNEIKKDYPTISFTTVYNILKSIKEVGGLQELSVDVQCKHFDPDTSNHHHVMCTKCNKIIDVIKDYTSALQLPKEVTESFNIKSFQVNFYGRCEDCR